MGTVSLFLISSSSLFFGPFLGYILNGLLPKKWKLLLVEKAIKDSDFESLVMRAFKQESLLLITLKTNKVYVGWAVSAPNPSASRKHLRFLPYLSGYRDSETQEVIFMTDYFNILNRVSQEGNDFDHLCIEDFEVVVPTDQIVSCHLFDLEAYFGFIPEEKDITEEVLPNTESNQ